MLRIIRTISPLLLVFIFQISGNAQGKSLLWKVSGKGLTTPSYLFGTVHMICKNELSFAPAVTTALQNAQSMCMEIDLMNNDDHDNMRALIMHTDANYSLRQLFDSTDYATLNRYFLDSLQFNLASLDKAKPFMLTTLLLAKQIPCNDEDIASPDRVLAAMAINQKKPIATLETVESQMALFDSIPDTAEAAMIMHILRDIKANDKEAHELTNIWKQQDLDKLYQLVIQSPDLKDYQNLMLFQRNAAWVPRIEQLMKKGSLFVAVGAAHLAGNKGLISLLRKQGYKVEAVN
ncbi:TraB/GumN family protein [Chitinophaga sp. HK235]|uniref:TraB/GumN family protein n=1 Tax=Chitinophaga sp. HK235 TaxID=2952571 RepID=UPI001BA59B95|nr:TraB/GumN family protein [Chitinophaga sp. HK235]